MLSRSYIVMCIDNNFLFNIFQGWALYSKGGIKHQTLCVAHINNRITLQQCKEDTSQKFELLRNGLIFHSATHQCLSHDGRFPTLVECDREHYTDTSLEWDFLLHRT